MSTPLDPWADAQRIARRLQQPGAELLVALGAEAWCGKCQILRPRFEQLCAAQAPATLTWLWLDLEDHAEFLGDFVPEELPLLLRWREAKLVQAALLEGIDSEAVLHDRLRELPLPADAPALWQALAQANWASG